MCPLYDFTCENNHTIEARKDYGTPSIPCPECGLTAIRVEVYRDQYIFGETCAKNQRRAEVPREERRLDKDYKLFQEASAEVDYHAKREEYQTGQEPPNPKMWQRAKRKARNIKMGIEAPLKVRHA